jgi:carboxyl-terminal processing protease
MKIQKAVLFTLFISGSYFASAQLFDSNKSLTCEWVAPIQEAYLTNHLVYKNKDAELKKRVIEQYVKSIDPAKIYLLESDVSVIKESMKNVFDTISNKDCQFMNKAQETLVKRVQERTEYVKKELGKDFKFNKETEFTYDPDKKTFPVNEKEANEFINKYLQFQVANYVAE